MSFTKPLIIPPDQRIISLIESAIAEIGGSNRIIKLVLFDLLSENDVDHNQLDIIVREYCRLNESLGFRITREFRSIKISRSTQ